MIHGVPIALLPVCLLTKFKGTNYIKPYWVTLINITAATSSNTVLVAIVVREGDSKS